jgi:hypothetical protein
MEHVEGTNDFDIRRKHGVSVGMVVVKMRVDHMADWLIGDEFEAFQDDARAASGVVPSSTSRTSRLLTMTGLLLPARPVA